MATARVVRPLKDTPMFRKNQKCWVKWTAGTLDACVVGRYRGKGRYVTAWIHADQGQYEPAAVKEVTVNEEFLMRLGLP